MDDKFKKKLQSGCPTGNGQITGYESGQRREFALSNVLKLECAVLTKLANNIISLERPFLDFIVMTHLGTLARLQHSVCVTARLASMNLATTPISCTITPFDSAKQSCLLRIFVPLSWFPIKSGQKQMVSLLHSVTHQCETPGADSHRTQVMIQAPGGHLPSIDLDRLPSLLHLSFHSPNNSTFATNSVIPLLVHLKYVESNETRLVAIQLRLSLNDQLKLLSVSSAEPKHWTVQVGADSHQASHTTFTCHYNTNMQKFDGYILMMFIKVKTTKPIIKNDNDGNVVDDHIRIDDGHNDDGGDDGTHESFISAHWTVQYVLVENSTVSTKTPAKRVTTQFRVIADAIYALVPLVKDKSLMNTAVFSDQQTATSMRVFAITESGTLSDVTSSSHCLSAEARVLKASPTCSSIYVDGSELRGMTRVKVHVHYETLNTFIEITVWYPQLPVTVWISDPVLNVIEDWQVAVWRWLPGKRRRRDARQFGCVNKFQQAEVRILANYFVSDEQTGERIYLLGDRDTLIDLTPLAMHHVHSSNTAVATVSTKNDRIYVIAKRVGSARITVRSNAQNVDYGSAPITVTEETVSVERLSALAVVNVKLEIEPNHDNQRFYVVSSFVASTLTRKYQHATLAVRVHFSDDQLIELLELDGDKQYVLEAHTNEQSALALSQLPNGRLNLIALEDAPEVHISLQLHSAGECTDPDAKPIAILELPIKIQFEQPKLLGTGDGSINEQYSNDTTTALMANDDDSSSNGRRTQLLVGLVAVISVLIVILHTSGLIVRRPLNHGYEKIVLPILSRLSSTNSCGKDENSHEWIWLSKEQIVSDSIDSRYSQKSTVDVGEENTSELSLNSSSTQRSISYRGSEISVFISPQPIVAIHHDSLIRPVRNCRWKRECELSSNSAMIDSSSSEYNLFKYSTDCPPKSPPYKNGNNWCPSIESQRGSPCTAHANVRDLRRDSQLMHVHVYGESSTRETVA